MHEWWDASVRTATEAPSAHLFSAWCSLEMDTRDPSIVVSNVLIFPFQSHAPLMLEILRATGCFVFDKQFVYCWSVCFASICLDRPTELHFTWHISHLCWGHVRVACWWALCWCLIQHSGQVVRRVLDSSSRFVLFRVSTDAEFLRTPWWAQRRHGPRRGYGSGATVLNRDVEVADVWVPTESVLLYQQHLLSAETTAV